MESIGFINIDHRIKAGMCGDVTEATQAILQRETPKPIVFLAPLQWWTIVEYNRVFYAF